MGWSDERGAWALKVAENVLDHYQCTETQTIDGTTTIGSALAELKAQLESQEQRPFTYWRLKELVEFDAGIQLEYKRGDMYLLAVRKVANVASPLSALDDFDALLDTRAADGIRLESIPWTEEPAWPDAIKNCSL